MSNLESNPDFVSVEVAAASRSVCTKTIRNWIKSGKLPAYEMGPKLIRISVLDLKAFAKPARQDNWASLNADRSAMTESARKKLSDQVRPVPAATDVESETNTGAFGGCESGIA
jgi:excisionase family DNA binding protein